MAKSIIPRWLATTFEPLFRRHEWHRLGIAALALITVVWTNARWRGVDFRTEWYLALVTAVCAGLTIISGLRRKNILGVIAICFFVLAAFSLKPKPYPKPTVPPPNRATIQEPAPPVDDDEKPNPNLPYVFSFTLSLILGLSLPFLLFRPKQIVDGGDSAPKNVADRRNP